MNKVYVRKTRDIWKFYCDYGQGWELETTEDTREMMKENKRLYLENSKYPIKEVKCREPIKGGTN
jgi:hypothetical protein